MMHSIIGIIGLALFTLGCLHYFPFLSQLDTRIARILQARAESTRLINTFRELWFFGRTPFALTLLILLVLGNWRKGVIALVIFGLIVGGELLLKRNINRPRPFSRDQNIKMLQPQKPLDPSFPSGDVLRIWYLIVITGTLLGDQGTYWAGLIILALLVSLGRLIMGVHYLSDVLAGAGLGLLGAGTTIWLWQYFHML